MQDYGYRCDAHPRTGKLAQFTLRGRRRNARLESADGSCKDAGKVLWRRARLKERPGGRIRVEKPGVPREDSDHTSGLTIERDRARDKRRIALEVSLPIIVAEHDAVAAGNRVLRRKDAADSRPRSQESKEARAHLRRIVSCGARVPEIDGRALQSLGMPVPVGNLPRGHSQSLAHKRACLR